MLSYKSAIPVTWVVMSINQIAGTLFSASRFPGVESPSVEEFSAEVLFGGEDDFSKEDEEKVREKLLDLANRVSYGMLLQQTGKSQMTSSTETTKSCMDKVLAEYGYQSLLDHVRETSV